MKHPLIKYLREEHLPTIFCPGCGDGIVMKALFMAFDELGIEKLDRYIFVSGIGCAAWIPSPHIKADTVHTLHGRAIPIATGIKLARPDLEVIVVGGDGDIAGIGGNHLLHAARRNMDIMTIMVNNLVYGMTGGQLAPTTPIGFKTSTTPYGNIEYPLDTCMVVASAGANYVARWTVAHFKQLKDSFKKALHKKGFRFIEVVAQCTSRVTNRMGIPPSHYMKELLRKSINISKVEFGSQIHDDQIIIGEYIDRDRESYIELMARMEVK